jgi:hypothetical protein
LGESTIGLLFCGVSGGMVHLLFILGVGVDSVDRCKVREQVWRIIRRRGGISA